MADITMCEGTNCPLKELCYRYTAPKNEYHQAYFIEIPYKNNSCEYYLMIAKPNRNGIK